MLSVRENYCLDQVTFSGAEPSHPTIARVCLCWDHMPPADDCKRGLEPLKTYEASINESLASLAQQVVY
jgi:hypothetical protein